jgi:hypothetical protein
MCSLSLVNEIQILQFQFGIYDQLKNNLEVMEFLQKT